MCDEKELSRLRTEVKFLRERTGYMREDVEERWKRLIAERDEARAEVEKLSESANAAWEAECVMRDQRDRYHAEWKQERQEVERLKREVSDAQIALRAQEHRDQWLMAQSVGYGFYKRGAEAMREACARWMSEREGISQWVYDDALSALPIPEEP